MRRFCAALLLVATPLLADTPVPAPQPAELNLLSEHPVEGIVGGNLSGLAWCGDAVWAVSDRDDSRIYRLDAREAVWRAEAEDFVAPPASQTALPWGLRMRSWIAGMARGGELDFEGLSCDALGNRYLVSESQAAVLLLPMAGEPQWLTLPDGLVRQARASGMLLHFNSLFEGVAVDSAGERLWLAAEAQRRGLLVLHKERTSWHCTGGCMLQSEGGSEPSPAQLSDEPTPVDYSGLAFYADKLFTLERQAHRICRRTPGNGEVERCWSFAAEALTPQRRYPVSYGMAEALWIDEQGAWIGVDNGDFERADGERRPIVWRFAAPKDGWGQTK